MHKLGTSNDNYFEQTHNVSKFATCDIEIRSKVARAQQPENPSLRHTVGDGDAALEKSPGPTRECPDRGDWKPN